MNIDLRNISEDFEKQVNRIKKEFDINTNSKAVEHCVIKYLDKIGEIERLKIELHNTKNQLNDEKYKLSSLKKILTTIME